jgi:hypothetical protein
VSTQLSYLQLAAKQAFLKRFFKNLIFLPTMQGMGTRVDGIFLLLTPNKLSGDNTSLTRKYQLLS